MTRQKIPAAPLALGLAGLIPFVWGTLSLFIPALQEFGSAAFGARFVGPYVQVFYGAIILAFMSGVLWGFATKSSGREAVIGYGLSVLPALWAFFATGGGHSSAALGLIIGYIGLLGIEAMVCPAKAGARLVDAPAPHPVGRRDHLPRSHSARLKVLSQPRLE